MNSSLPCFTHHYTTSKFHALPYASAAPKLAMKLLLRLQQ